MDAFVIKAKVVLESLSAFFSGGTGSVLPYTYPDLEGPTDHRAKRVSRATATALRLLLTLEICVEVSL